MNKTYEEMFDEDGIKSILDSGLSVPSKESMTCNGCPSVAECEFAWDLYNTQGECLSQK